MVGIICITTILILNERKSKTTGGGSGGRNVTADKAAIAVNIMSEPPNNFSRARMDIESRK